jgi:hypothetical protein
MLVIDQVNSTRFQTKPKSASKESTANMQSMGFARKAKKATQYRRYI